VRRGGEERQRDPVGRVDAPEAAEKERPERDLAGRAEKVVALATPAIVGGALVALPLADRAPTRDPKRRLPYLGGLAGLLALIGGLTIASLAADARDGELVKRDAKAEQRAALARKLARDNGIPTSSAADIFLASPFGRARALFASRCKTCHDAQSKDRKGPIIGPSHGDRAWIKGFLVQPSGDRGSAQRSNASGGVTCDLNTASASWNADSAACFASRRAAPGWSAEAGDRRRVRSSRTSRRCSASSA
jgi:hypothetical protein